MQDFFISLFNGIIGFLVDLVPDFSSNGAEKVSSGIDTIAGYMGKMSYIFPMGTVFTILSLVIAILFGRFAMFLVNLVIKRIRGG